MKNRMSYFFLFLASFSAVGCGSVPIEKNENPQPEAKLFTGITSALAGREEIINDFSSEILNNKRKLRVYLPKGYGDSVETYPVLYMHDGQNVFAPGGPFGCWNIDTTVDVLTDAGTINPVIVVGIDNTSNRELEYNFGNRGIVEKYAQFVITEVMPFINAQYRTKTGRENTAIMGSSYGGNASLYFAWYHSEVFGMAGCVSSALQWDNLNFVNSVVNSKEPKKPVKFWIDAGDSEDRDDNGDGVDFFGEAAIGLANSLLQQGWIYTEDLLYEVAHEAGHNEAAWAARVYKPLQFFFQKDQAFVPVSIEARSSVPQMDLGGVVPRSILFARAAYSNGIIADIPPSLVKVTSNHEDYYNLENGILKLNPVTAKAPDTIVMETSFSGLSSVFSIDLVPAISAEVLLDFTVTAPLNSPKEIYLVGDFSGWDFPRAVKLQLAETVIDGKIFRTSMTVKRGANMSFKFCSGASWSLEEYNGGGKPTSNRTIKVSGDRNEYSGTVLQWRAVP